MSRDAKAGKGDRHNSSIPSPLTSTPTLGGVHRTREPRPLPRLVSIPNRRGCRGTHRHHRGRQTTDPTATIAVLVVDVTAITVIHLKPMNLLHGRITKSV